MPHAGGEAFEVDLGGSSRRTSRPPPRLSSGTSSNTYSRAGTPATARDPNPRNTRFAGRANPQSGSSGIERKRIGEYGSPPLNSSSTSISSFKIGQQVKVKKANHKPGFEDGIILRKNTDGTYDVEYTLIGSTERYVDVKRIRAKVTTTDELSSSSTDPGSIRKYKMQNRNTCRKNKI